MVLENLTSNDFPIGTLAIDGSYRFTKLIGLSESLSDRTQGIGKLILGKLGYGES